MEGAATAWASPGTTISGRIHRTPGSSTLLRRTIASNLALRPSTPAPPSPVSPTGTSAAIQTREPASSGGLTGRRDGPRRHDAVGLSEQPRFRGGRRGDPDAPELRHLA